jgi:hypothetical protein
VVQLVRSDVRHHPPEALAFDKIGFCELYPPPEMFREAERLARRSPAHPGHSVVPF